MCTRFDTESTPQCSCFVGNAPKACWGNLDHFWFSATTDFRIPVGMFGILMNESSLHKDVNYVINEWSCNTIMTGKESVKINILKTRLLAMVDGQKPGRTFYTMYYLLLTVASHHLYDEWYKGSSCYTQSHYLAPICSCLCHNDWCILQTVHNAIDYTTWCSKIRLLFAGSTGKGLTK